MTIERPDLRRDNHDLLRKVQEVWQVIEHGSMMPKVKVVSCPPIFPSPSTFQSNHQRREERWMNERNRDNGLISGKDHHDPCPPYSSP
jgi:hypothetical protein